MSEQKLMYGETLESKVWRDALNAAIRGNQKEFPNSHDTAMHAIATADATLKAWRERFGDGKGSR